MGGGGAFCGAIRSDLIFVNGRAKLDSATYVRMVLEPALAPFWHQCCEKYGWAIVQVDNAPGHKGYAKAYRELNGMEALEWPAELRDLNLIEACWGDVETELGKIWGRAADVEALQLYLAVCWARAITEERLDALVESVPARL